MEAFCTKQTSTLNSLIAVTWEVHQKGSLRTHRQTSQTTKHNILSKQLTLISSPVVSISPAVAYGPGEITVLEVGPVSGLQELECGPGALARLWPRPPDR